MVPLVSPPRRLRRAPVLLAAALAALLAAPGGAAKVDALHIGTTGTLASEALGLTSGGGRYLRLFVEHQSRAAGKTLDTFFAKVTPEQNAEDALDDVVDGAVQAAVVDRAALEGYKRRKPGRFGQFKPVAQSK